MLARCWSVLHKTFEPFLTCRQHKTLAGHLWMKVQVGKLVFVCCIVSNCYFCPFTFKMGSGAMFFLKDSLYYIFYICNLYLRQLIPREPTSFVLLITARLGCNMAAGRPFWLQSELQSHRAPSGCSVVSVDPVGLAAATSGYWVSAGGHDNQNTWWWHKGRLCASIIIFSSFLKFSNVLFAHIWNSFPTRLVYYFWLCSSYPLLVIITAMQL